MTGLTALAVITAVGACSNTATKEATVSSVGPQTSPAARASAHNDADMMFAHMMIPHHQQAVQMSDMILAKQGIDPRVLDLAKQIKAAQGPEIEQMQAWLNRWGKPGMSDAPGTGATPGTMPPDHGGGMHGSGSTADPPTTTTVPMPSESVTPGSSMMPSGSMTPGMGDAPGMDGMMSPADMRGLQNAQGVEATKLYLTQMVKHHQGAISMAQNEIKGGQFPEAITMAKSIVTSQQQEIDTMNQILSSL